ncbi:MAG: hypothetical protein ACP5KV_00875 [Candidatus Methanomethylicaceae archaeon]
MHGSLRRLCAGDTRPDGWASVTVWIEPYGWSRNLEYPKRGKFRNAPRALLGSN